MMIMQGMLSSITAEHYTPPVILDLVRDIFVDGVIDLDPCWHPKSLVQANRHHTPDTDGLSIDWTSHASVYMNPPYGRQIGKWMAKCCETSLSSTKTEIIALVPGRTDAEWFHASVRSAARVCFLRGRLRFWTTNFCNACNKPGMCAPSRGHDASMVYLDEAIESGPAPFPSAIFYWGPRSDAFDRVFSSQGFCFGG